MFCDEHGTIDYCPECTSEENEKWVSVKEKLPDVNDEEYIVFMCKGAYTMVTTLMFIDGEFGDEDFDDIPQSLITHWMPLPDPPKGDS